jgi:preprotein translocase subunit SecB
MENTKKEGYKLHAIQLVDLRVAELAIKVDLSFPKDANLGSFTIETGRSNYDREKHQIQVMMKVMSGYDEEKTPLKLVVELHARFEIDESSFDIQYVEDWAERNAPLVLYPYARENVYALTARSGFSEALLPLIEIPTFRVPAPSGQ